MKVGIIANPLQREYRLLANFKSEYSPNFVVYKYDYKGPYVLLSHLEFDYIFIYYSGLVEGDLRDAYMSSAFIVHLPTIDRRARRVAL